MSNAELLEPFAVKSYRYLRLSIVVVVLSLIASVLIERSHVSCWQESISAYFYTPVQAIFVSALVVIGVSLIAIRGSTDVEDVLLNLAGVLAAIVAFVPTSPPSRMCSSVEVVVTDAEPYIDNNVLAFAIGGATALVVTVVVAKVMRKPTMPKLDKPSWIGLGIGAAILVVGLIWYFGFRESFLERAHGGAAVAMFVVVGIVIALNAWHRKRQRKSWWLYALIAAAMILSVVAVVVGKLIDSDWRHQILWLEILELTAFAVYWVAQTFEHWEGGVPTGADREIPPARP
jgi:energy-converting hydrogenase Eha subunit A